MVAIPDMMTAEVSENPKSAAGLPAQVTTIAGLDLAAEERLTVVL